jgi:acyl-coenzyme A synthetase/AMP-(fatty) acid ligase
VKPTDCAYMIYTSGTTGTPKGVACHHIGPVNMIFYESGVDMFSKGVPEEDVVGCAAPLIFDVFVYSFFGALGSGLALSLDMKCCTMLVCTPSVAGIFLQDKMNNITMMNVGGEACIQGLESKVSTFVNVYGPTETSIMCTAGNRSDTIGRPLPNTLCYVVHPDDGTLCPPGVSGELWVGGIGVSIGYHNRPELTAEKFIPNPFAFGRGKVYKTGDRVKWDADGELVFLGRFDHQVKVRGYRIELGEIQAELEKQEGVNGALVVVYEEKLVAFVASGAADSSSNEAFAKLLMGALKSENSSLTSYMIPSHILVMEEFPLTLNGKIDRKCLMAGLVDLGEEGFATETESRPLVVGSIKSNIGHLEGAA